MKKKLQWEKVKNGIKTGFMCEKVSWDAANAKKVF